MACSFNTEGTGYTQVKEWVQEILPESVRLQRNWNPEAEQGGWGCRHSDLRHAHPGPREGTAGCFRGWVWGKAGAMCTDWGTQS